MYDSLFSNRMCEGYYKKLVSKNRLTIFHVFGSFGFRTPFVFIMSFLRSNRTLSRASKFVSIMAQVYPTKLNPLIVRSFRDKLSAPAPPKWRDFDFAYELSVMIYHQPKPTNTLGGGGRIGTRKIRNLINKRN